MKYLNHELESSTRISKYLSSLSSELHFQALERVVNKYNDGLVTEKAANKMIDSINDVRKKYTNLKSMHYAPIPTQKLEALYRTYSEKI